MINVRNDVQINIQSGHYTIFAPTFDANNQVFNFILDPSSITRPGVYVMVKSNAISNFSRATAYFDGDSPLSVHEVFRNSSVIFSDATYDCILVRVG